MRYTRGVNSGCFKDSGFMLTPCCNMRLSLHWVSLVCSDNVTSCESCHVSVMCEKSRLKFENEERSFECHGPSHGGFYMAKGTFYIRIGLPPRVVSGDHLASSRCGLIVCYLHCHRAYPMSRDWGCTSMSSPYLSMWP